MLFLRVEEIKRQLNLDVDDDSYPNELLEQLGDASESYIETFINRRLYGDGEVPDINDETGMTINPAIKQAMLLMVGHLFENRESTTPLKLLEIPMGVEALCGGFRIRNL